MARAPNDIGHRGPLDDGPRLRYSGSLLGYQLAPVIAGCPAPLLATALFAAYNAIAFYILVCAVVSVLSTALLPDYTDRDISAEYDAV